MTGALLEQSKTLCANLDVNAANMRANLGATRGHVLSEGVMLATLHDKRFRGVDQQADTSKRRPSRKRARPPRAQARKNVRAGRAGPSGLPSATLWLERIRMINGTLRSAKKPSQPLPMNSRSATKARIFSVPPTMRKKRSKSALRSSVEEDPSLPDLSLLVPSFESTSQSTGNAMPV